MYRFFIQSGQVSEHSLYIDGEDVNHIKNVLRMKAGEEMEAVDDDRFLYHCKISAISPDRIDCEILSREIPDNELGNEITLFMGLPKSDKMDLIIQKAVELGVRRVVPTVTGRTVVKLDEKRASTKVKRWQAIAESAAKQSKRTTIPEICAPVRFKQALEQAAGLDHVLIPYEEETGIVRTRDVIRRILPGENVGVFIGPEGGFEAAEVEEAKKAGAESVTLGRRILRTETAAIAVLAILMYELEA